MIGGRSWKTRHISIRSCSYWRWTASTSPAPSAASHSREKARTRGGSSGCACCGPGRRRGLAQALLLHSFGQLYAHGMRCIGLGVDADSLTGATRLYEKVGMHVERRHELWEKELPIGDRVGDAEPRLTPRRPAVLRQSLRACGVKRSVSPHASTSRETQPLCGRIVPYARRHSPPFQIWYDRASRRNLRR